MTQARLNRKPTFFWQGVLILLPVVVMAAIGLVAILRDKAAVEQDAQQRATELARQLAPELGRRVGAHLAELDLLSAAWVNRQHQGSKPLPGSASRAGQESLAAWQAANPGWRLDLVLPNRLAFSSETELLWPAVYPQPPQPPTWFRALSARQRAAWDALRQAAATPGGLQATNGPVERFLATQPSAEARANAQWLLLREQVAALPDEQAARLLGKFAKEYPQVLSEAGLPLSTLAIAELARSPKRLRAGLEGDSRMDQEESLLSLMLSSLLEEPSIFTAQLLGQLQGLLASQPRVSPALAQAVQRAQELWSGEQRLRHMAELLQRSSRLRGLAAMNFWLEAGQERYFCLLRPRQGTNALGEVRLYPKAVIEQAFAKALREARLEVPDYLGLTAALEAEPLELDARLEVQVGTTTQQVAERQKPALAASNAPMTDEQAQKSLPRPRRRIVRGRMVNAAPLLAITSSRRDAVLRGTRTLAEASGRVTGPEAWAGEGPLASGEAGSFSELEPVSRRNAGFLASPGNGQGLDFKPFPESGLPLFTLQVHLADPDLLYARQRQRTGLFGGLILLSLLAAVVGLAAAHRAFHRQLRLNELKSNFVSSVSHELRAPLASVRLMAESLDRGKITEAPRQQEYFRFIVQECRRLSGLIENVLDFSRIEQGRKQYEFEPTDLPALVQQTVQLMEPYAAERQVQLALSINYPQLSTLNSQPVLDGKALQQALINLLDNAIKHSPQGKTVELGLEVTGEEERGASSGGSVERRACSASRVTLWVEDQGPGIPAEEHEKIFERFYRRGSELRRETQGVGIGLSIVKHVVEAHGGRVLVRSAVGQGSRFTLELPLMNNKKTKEQR